MFLICSPDRNGGLRLPPCVSLLVALSPMTSISVGAQARAGAQPLVIIRELQIAPMLLAFGLDTGKLRDGLREAAERVNRLAPANERDALALDVAMTVPPSTGSTELDPRALLRVEVGRNRMEAGQSRSLAWERTTALGETGGSRSHQRQFRSWRQLCDALEREVLAIVTGYLQTSGPRP